MRILLLFISVVFFACENGNRTNRNYQYEPIKPIYIEYPDSGFVKKYFDADWNIIHDSTNASYYRTATYLNGQPKVDSDVRDYFITGELQFEGQLSSENPDNPHGFTKWYYKNGNLSSTRNYKHGVLNGLYRNYFENGRIKEKARVIDNELDGEYLEYYDLTNEPVKSKGHFSKGTSDGEFIEYYETGILKEKKAYKKGELNGRKRTYHPNGKLEESKSYVDGALSGEFYEYFSNGNYRTKGYYHRNSESGDWFYYDEDGDYKKYSHVTFRIGAICNDGSRSSATGRGACSWHGGVNHWLVRTEKRFVFGTGKYKNYNSNSYYNF